MVALCTPWSWSPLRAPRPVLMEALGCPHDAGAEGLVFCSSGLALLSIVGLAVFVSSLSDLTEDVGAIFFAVVFRLWHSVPDELIGSRELRMVCRI